MVSEMILFEVFQESAAHRQMVGGIVGKVVDQIADDESRHQWIDPYRGIHQGEKDQVEETIKSECQGNTDDRGHYQAGLYLWLCMMDAMKQEEHLALALSSWSIMEQEAMEHIFRKGPDEQTREETCRDMYRHCRDLMGDQRSAHEIHSNRQPDDDDCHRSNVREKLKRV